MKKFRRIWIAIVILVSLAFAGYCAYSYAKTDSSGPVISGGEEKITVSIHDGDEVLLEGITATDKKDGDVTSSLIVEKISNFYDGVRTVTYAAFDSDNHISKVQREISYTDYTSPRFELTGSLRFRAGETVDIDKIVTAQDCLDGDLSNKVKIRMDASVNNRVIGFYRVNYVVTNSAGDSVTLPIDVEIYEPYNHEVDLYLDRYLVYYTGEEIDYYDYLSHIRKGNLEYAFEGSDRVVDMTVPEISEDNEEDVAEEDTDSEEVVESQVISKNTVEIESSVDPSKPGVYPVYYYFNQEQENYTYSAKEVLYVVVE